MDESNLVGLVAENRVDLLIIQVRIIDNYGARWRCRDDYGMIHFPYKNQTAATVEEAKELARVRVLEFARRWTVFAEKLAA